MCGIVGFACFSGQPINQTELDDFTGSLEHRGPDGRGTYITADQKIGLGHTRLAILDLDDRASQPFLSTCGRYAMVYNGEVFNFLEIKRELESKGYNFKTSSDTEVVLQSYVQWGTGCFNKFNGMWSLAILDLANNSVLLSRDRFGIKPLYYATLQSGDIAWASETKAFRYMPGYSREFDSQSLTDGLRNSYNLEASGRTLFKNVHGLPAGALLTLTEGQPPKLSKWWNTSNHIVEVPGKYAEQVERFQSLFEDSCALRLRSDVSVGCALSGGLDSNSVYAVCQRILTGKNSHSVRSGAWSTPFTLSFEGSEFDEVELAKIAASMHGEHLNVASFEKAKIADEIVAATKFSDFIYLSPPVVQKIYERMSRSGLKVSLDGHGADEAFFGYLDMIRSEKDIVASSRPTRDKLVNAFPDIAGGFRRFKGKLFAEKAIGLWLYGSPSRFQFDCGEFEQDDPNATSYKEIHSGRLPTLLRNFDLASMANGVEVRMPFMDWRIVTFALSLPLEYKVHQGVRKRIIRDAMKGEVPHEILNDKRKIGVNAPSDTWFSGALSELFSDIVQSQEFRESSVWNGKAIAQFVCQKTQQNNWSPYDAQRVWPFINANLIGA